MTTLRQDKYYKSQKNHWVRKSAIHLANTWTNKNTLDYWRHNRLYKTLDPILKHKQNQEWLTVGDGKLARDAYYILSKGKHVVASDIETKYLKEAKKLKLIESYKKANAEKLPFRTNSFDYVLCKESYHHFPRPTIALYEMLRVARKGVVLIEPADVKKRVIRNFLPSKNPPEYVNSFEESGNYVYQISEREIEKMALGIGLPAVAFKQIDDVYFEGVENVSQHKWSALRVKILSLLALMNLLYLLGVRHKNMLSVIIFKTSPNINLANALKEDAYQFVRLPKNPYIK